MTTLLTQSARRAGLRQQDSGGAAGFTSSRLPPAHRACVSAIAPSEPSSLQRSPSDRQEPSSSPLDTFWPQPERLCTFQTLSVWQPFPSAVFWATFPRRSSFPEGVSGEAPYLCPHFPSFLQPKTTCLPLQATRTTLAKVSRLPWLPAISRAPGS